MYPSDPRARQYSGAHQHARNSVALVIDRVPGLFILAAVVFCLLGAVIFPITLLYIAAGLALYALLRFIFVGLASVRGLKQIAIWEHIDWKAKYAAQSGLAADVIPWGAVHHLVIIPNYQEPLTVVRKSLNYLASSSEAASMTVVLAMEADETGSSAKAAQLQAEYAGQFAQILYTVHPNNLPGELRCKSANQVWALRHVRHKLVDQFQQNPSHIVVTTMDADTLWHPNYFSALTYHFATSAARHETFWQAPIRYHGNIYEANPVMRLVNVYTSATELAYLQATWWQSLPISSYSLSLTLLDAAGGWDANVIADEWHMYIKAFFANNGQIRLTPIFLPFLATVVAGDTLWQTLKKRYAQSLRHAWGSKAIGYTIAHMLYKPQIPLMKVLPVLSAAWHDLFLSSVGWIILTLGGQLPLLLHPVLRERILTDFWYFPPFMILQLIGMVMLILGIVFLMIDIRLRPPRTHPATLPERIQSLLGFILLPVFGILFIVVPVFHAQLQIMLGRQLAFTVTEKA